MVYLPTIFKGFCMYIWSVSITEDIIWKLNIYNIQHQPGLNKFLIYFSVKNEYLQMVYYVYVCKGFCVVSEACASSLKA
jgi:hypothetical protein